MKVINTIKDRNVYLFCIIIMLMSYAISFVLTYLFKICTPNLDYGTNIYFFLRELVILFGNVMIVFMVGHKHIFQFSLKAFLKSQRSGAYFYFLGIVGVSITLAEASKASETFKSPLQIISFVLFVIAVGLAEESVYRGIIADSLFESKANTVKGVIGTVLLSGFLFGCSHFGNLISGQDWESTIIQVIATSMLGVLLSAIYYKRRSFYGVALLHAILDFMSMSEKGFILGQSIADNAGSNIEFMARLAQALRSQLPFLIVAFIILRPSVIRKMISSKELA